MAGFNADQPRDDKGMWSPGGSGGAGQSVMERMTQEKENEPKPKFKEGDRVKVTFRGKERTGTVRSVTDYKGKGENRYGLQMDSGTPFLRPGESKLSPA